MPLSPDGRPARELHLNTNVLNSGKHDHGWRLQGDPLSYLDIRYYQYCAQVAERGTLDALFLADGVAIGPEAGTRPWNSLEPTVVLAAIAAVTERVGLVATASTTFNEPYNLARRFASLDQISGGRAAVNIVTSLDARSAANFSLERHPDGAERYARAEEFVDVLIKLWDSWEDDALVADRKTGVFTDVTRVHAIDHQGKHFSVAGPLNVPRPPQGRPVIVQAGSSEAGRALAARTADALFTVQNTFEEAQVFYREIKDRARRFGRDPEQVLILPGLLPIIGSTEAEAQARLEELDSFIDFDRERERFESRFGFPAGSLELDKPISADLLDSLDVRGSTGFFDGMRNLATRSGLTVRELISANGAGHRQVVGAPEQIADTIEHWFTERAADGFNLSGDYFPSGLELFVDHVVPLLRQRGIFRHEYAGTTLRDHLGLSRPASQYQDRDAERALTAGSMV
jgi:FMN-dependent oxidoreductase (nitrilotriacetate monooxygenase family)